MTEEVALLHKEFPELEVEVVENTLGSNGGDLSAARAALLRLTSSEVGSGETGVGVTQQVDRGTSVWNSWLGFSPVSSHKSSRWTLGLDEAQGGLTGLGSQLSLSLKKAAQVVSQYVPAELNLFAAGTVPTGEGDHDESSQLPDAGATSVSSTSKATTIRRGGSFGLPSSPTFAAAADGASLSPKLAKKCE